MVGLAASCAEGIGSCDDSSSADYGWVVLLMVAAAVIGVVVWRIRVSRRHGGWSPRDPR